MLIGLIMRASRGKEQRCKGSLPTTSSTQSKNPKHPLSQPQLRIRDSSANQINNQDFELDWMQVDNL